MDQPLSDIVYEIIKETSPGYSFGKIRYLNFDLIVIISAPNGIGIGYINATQMCKLKGQRYGKWAANQDAKNRINHVQKSLPDDVPATIYIGGGRSKLCGTYVHERILPSVAASISQDFGDIISDMISARVREENRMIILAKDIELGKVQFENLSLREEVKLMMSQMNKGFQDSNNTINGLREEVCCLKNEVHHQNNMFNDLNGILNDFFERDKRNLKAILKTKSALTKTNDIVSLVGDKVNVLVNTVIDLEDELLETNIEKTDMGNKLIEIEEKVVNLKINQDITNTKLKICSNDRAIPPVDPKKQNVLVIVELPLTSKSLYRYQLIGKQRGTLSRDPYYKIGVVVFEQAHTNPSYAIGRIRDRFRDNMKHNNIGFNDLSKEDIVAFAQSILDEDKNVDNIKPTIYTEAILKGQTMNYLKDVCKKYLYTTKSSFKKDDFIGAIIREQAKWQVFV
jgi:hypothetical protein